MNHWYFVLLAYASFMALLLWDFLAPQFHFKRVIRNIKLRQIRNRSR